MTEKYDLNQCPEAQARATASLKMQDLLSAEARAKQHKADAEARLFDLNQRMPGLMLRHAQEQTEQTAHAIDEALAEVSRLEKLIAAWGTMPAASTPKKEGIEREIRRLDEKLDRRAQIELVFWELERGTEGASWPLLGHGDAERALVDFINVVGLEDQQVENLLARAERLGWAGVSK